MADTLIYILWVVTLAQLAVAMANLIFPEKPYSVQSLMAGLVSVLIPARNEEKNIGKLLDDLTGQPYRNIEIIVFDDLSEDKTCDVVISYALADPRVRLIRSDGLPQGWLGKNYGCHTLALEAKGEWFLFADSDVRISGGAIGRMTAMAGEKNLSMISVFPYQEIRSAGEWFTVPLMNYILLTLLPLRLVRTLSFSSLAAANGQFMFYSRDAYLATLPHSKLRDKKVEDILSARKLKREGHSIACLTGNSEIRCRMYGNYSDAIEGFSKNLPEFFGGSLAVAALFWFLTTAGPIVMFFSVPAPQALLYLSAWIVTRVFVSLASNQKILFNIVYAVPQQFAMGHIILRSMLNRYIRKFSWKGRAIN